MSKQLVDIYLCIFYSWSIRLALPRFTVSGVARTCLQYSCSFMCGRDRRAWFYLVLVNKCILLAWSTTITTSIAYHFLFLPRENSQTTKNCKTSNWLSSIAGQASKLHARMHTLAHIRTFTSTSTHIRTLTRIDTRNNESKHLYCYAWAKLSDLPEGPSMYSCKRRLKILWLAIMLTKNTLSQKI